ncbi:hypothetical protein PTTG_05518 [Puccinia triticina 1-1 BBBD Race 1]|uniref:Secreted protein n=2 Tax=Puccinia triticina TaxID=208348 RepID=A0A180H1U5_PUCT1|nr:hypothetical protein PTTG_05518 [Puccinia triticina 1-1 BBBD Race 1]
MALRSIIIASLVVAVFSTGVFTTENDELPHDQDCTWYTDANTTSATCNGVPGMRCTGGCTGHVTARNCTTSHEINVQEPPLTTEKCTVSYGRSSATMAVCLTEHQSFTCYGSPSGKARCKGCSGP